MKPRFRSLLLVPVLLSAGLGLVGVTSLVPSPIGPTPVEAATGSTKFVPLAAPERLLDTRTNLGNSPAGRPLSGSVISTQITGRAGIPADATAIVLNVTAVNSSGGGFVTVFPFGTAQPTASNVNLDARDQTIPNLVTVRIGSGGRVSLYTSIGADLLADAFGYYVPSVSSRSGRYIAQTPFRTLDTRSSVPLLPNGTRRVSLTGVPADAVAAVLNVTVTAANQPGFWTVYPAGTTLPVTSNLNVAGAGQTIANQVIVPVRNAAIDVFTTSGGHFIVDVSGYFTGASAADSGTGLFVPMSPTRFLDTRLGAEFNPLGSKVKLLPGWTVETSIIGRSGIPAGASGVVMNTTLVEASRSGFITVYPAGSSLPVTSTVNAERRGQTIANHTITPISARGVASFNHGGSHVIQDVAGWFTGTPQPAPNAVVRNELPAVTFPVTMTIPKIGVTTSVVSGIGIEQLNYGPGHWPGTALPGRVGNSAFFGHRVSHTAPFRDLNRLGPGDQVILKSNGYNYVYTYKTTIITTPDDVDTFGGWASWPTITLVACHPPTSITYRIVVRAELVDVY